MFKGVSGLIQGVKGVSGLFHEVLGAFQEIHKCFTLVSGDLNGVSEGFRGASEDPWGFQAK